MQSNVLPISCTTHATNQLYYLYYQSAVLALLMSHTIHTTQLHAHTTSQHTPCPTNQLCYLYYQSVIHYVQMCHLHQTPAGLPITCYYWSSGWVYLYLNQRWKEFVPERGTARMEETWSVRPSTGIAAECTGLTACTIATVPEENWSISTRPRGAAAECTGDCTNTTVPERGHC